MTLEQRAHDNTSNDEISRQTQFLNFITDYTFAASEVVMGKTEIDTLFKD